jgi:hypothetical protein
MSERKYSGDPIDMSWQTPPWQNDGETLDAYTSEGEGKLMTENWPENATDPENLNDKQKRMILTAANHPDVNSPSKLIELSGTDVSTQYPHNTIKRHWPDRYWGVGGGVETSNELDIDVEKLRQRLLDGASLNKLVKEYPLSQPRLSAIVRGEEGVAPECETPPLKWLGGSEQRWAVAGEDNPTPNNGHGASPGDIDVSVDKIRERALNGESAVEIADSVGVSDAPIRKRLKGQASYAGRDCDIPALEYSQGKGWHIPDADEPDTQDDAEETRDLTTYDGQHRQPTMPAKQRERQTPPRWAWAVLLVVAGWLASKLLK